MATKAKRNSGMLRNVGWTVGVVAVLGMAVGIALSVSGPPLPELEGVETFADLGTEHLAAGESAPAYNSDPPTSGPHADRPAPCGIYREPVPDVNQLHSLEHGAVAIQYSPDLPNDQIESLESIGRSLGAEVIVAPRSGLSAPIALTAWTKRLLLQDVDTDVIRAFDADFGNRSPEPGAICPLEIDQSR